MFKTSSRILSALALASLLCSCAGHVGGTRPASSAATGTTSDTYALAPLPGPAPPGSGGEDGRSIDGSRSMPEAVPTAGEIFDFHPPGSRPGTWREPFVVSYTEGPLNAYRLRTLAELRRLDDHRYDLAPPTAIAAR